MTTNNIDTAVIDFNLRADRGGVTVEPLTQEAKNATKAYKGVYMDKFFVSKSLIEGFLQFAAKRFNACTSCTKD